MRARRRLSVVDGVMLAVVVAIAAALYTAADHGTPPSRATPHAIASPARTFCDVVQDAGMSSVPATGAAHAQREALEQSVARWTALEHSAPPAISADITLVRGGIQHVRDVFARNGYDIARVGATVRVSELPLYAKRRFGQAFARVRRYSERRCR